MRTEVCPESRYRNCPVCGKEMPRRRRSCTNACRQKAYRDRHLTDSIPRLIAISHIARHVSACRAVGIDPVSKDPVPVRHVAQGEQATMEAEFVEDFIARLQAKEAARKKLSPKLTKAQGR